MQEFTLEQIGMQVTALQNFFDQVTLIDPLAQAEVDPATLQATGPCRCCACAECRWPWLAADFG